MKRRPAVKDLVIFGTGPIAELAAFYVRGDTDRRVAGFTVDAAYRQGETCLGLPLAPFEAVESRARPRKASKKTRLVT